MNINTKEKILLVYSYKSKFWWINMLSYTIILLLSIASFIGSIIYNVLTTSIDNKLTTNLCILFALASIFAVIFWLLYNVSPSTTFAKLKTRSMYMDLCLILFTLMMYSTIGYLAYIILEANFQLIFIKSFVGLIWLSLAIIVLHIIMFVCNMIYLVMQSKLTLTNESDKYIVGSIKWQPNLIYSYWLDKIYFSQKILSKDDSQIVIYDKEGLKTKFLLEEDYNNFFKYTNILKRLTQTVIVVLISILVAFVIMLFATIEYWIKESQLSSQFIAFIWLFWINISILSSCYLWFININDFQMIKKDNENKFIDTYKSIIINYFDANSRLAKINELEFVWLMGVIRKIMLYQEYFIITSEQFQLRNTINNMQYKLKFTYENTSIGQKPNLKIDIYHS